MSRHTLLIHGSWAAAVVVAFGAGFLLRAPSPADETSPSASTKSERDVSSSAGSGPGFGSSPGLGTRSADDRGSGFLAGSGGGAAVAEGDLAALARQAVRDSNPITRRLAFSRLLEALTPENALAIREQLVELGADRGQWRDFNYGWGALAGKEAFEFAVASEENDLEAALSGWASANPNEALALLDNLPEELRDERDELAENVVAGVADTDRALATELAFRLAGEGNDEGQDLIEIVTRETLRATSPEEAALWSETLPEGPLKAAAMDRVANQYVESDPEAAAQWAQQFADQEYAARVIEEVGDEWAEREPLEAITWLEGLPVGPGQSAGLRSAFGEWEDRDPVAAGEYLLSMPASEQRDSAISGFVRGHAWQDPQVAIAWAQDIANPELRQESLTNVGRALFRRDPETASAWLPTSGLPPEVQQEIQNPRRRR